MHCTHCGMLKDASWTKAMSKSDKIKPVALVVIKLRLSEGISQLLTQSVTYSVSQSSLEPLNIFFLNSVANLINYLL